MIIDQFAAAVSKKRRAVGKACNLLRAAVGGELSHAVSVWKHAAANSAFAAAR